MTYAEHSAATQTRDDEHMIYEMYNYSQYEDGSVLNCVGMETLTAQEVADFPEGRGWTPLLKTIWRDMRRNAKAALKHGATRNLAPRV